MSKLWPVIPYAELPSVAYSYVDRLPTDLANCLISISEGLDRNQSRHIELLKRLLVLFATRLIIEDREIERVVTYGEYNTYSPDEGFWADSGQGPLDLAVMDPMELYSSLIDEMIIFHNIMLFVGFLHGVDLQSVD